MPKQTASQSWSSLPHSGSSAMPPRRLPRWIRRSLPIADSQHRFRKTQATMADHHLHTVCEEARCPNLNDCWSRGTATFMVAGQSCTRGCRFCAVQTLRQPPPVDPDEPLRLAAAVQRMGLKHVVVTVVNRDDLADGGASHYRRCVEAVTSRIPNVTVELLSSDLNGNLSALGLLLAKLPLQVFAHNVECVPRLDRLVRDPRASFAQSLTILREVKRLRPELMTKSSLMIGLGETDEEVTQVMQRLREAQVDLLTLGQYLSPGPQFLKEARFAPPSRFEQWQREAYHWGFKAVAAGSMVRSSYRAGQLWEQATSKP